MTEFTAKYEQNGSITAGPFEDGNIYHGITEVSRFWQVIQDKIKDEGLVVAPYVEPPIDLIAYAANARYEVEVGGTIWNGFPVHTDRQSQNKVMSEILAITVGSRPDDSKWKFKDDIFRTVTNAEFADLANTVRDHVAGAFEKEEQVQLKIKNGEITTTAQIDSFFGV